MYVCMWVYVYVCTYIFVRICIYPKVYACAYVCVCVYICTCIYVYACMCVCVYTYIYMYMCGCVYVCIYICMYVCMYLYIYMCVNVYVYVCVNIYMRVYAYIYTCIYMGEYVCVCMWTHINICEGPYHPCGLAAGGAVFIRVRIPMLPGTTASHYGLVDVQLPHSSDREYHIPLSESGTAVYPSQVVPSSNLAHLLLTINQQQGRASNKLAFCSSLTTSTLEPNPITTDAYFLTLNGPAAKVT